MSNIIEIKHSTHQIIIKPTKFTFLTDNIEEKGFVVFDSTGSRSFHYPVLTNANKNPIQYLQEILAVSCIFFGGGKYNFKDMMRHAYENKSSVMVGEKEVLWGEYEFLFAKQSFYMGKPDTAKIVQT